MTIAQFLHYILHSGCHFLWIRISPVNCLSVTNHKLLKPQILIKILSAKVNNKLCYFYNILAYSHRSITIHWFMVYQEMQDQINWFQLFHMIDILMLIKITIDFRKLPLLAKSALKTEWQHHLLHPLGISSAHLEWFQHKPSTQRQLSLTGHGKTRLSFVYDKYTVQHHSTNGCAVHHSKHKALIQTATTINSVCVY